jgi:hypothetical protein
VAGGDFSAWQLPVDIGFFVVGDRSFPLSPNLTNAREKLV